MSKFNNYNEAVEHIFSLKWLTPVNKDNVYTLGKIKAFAEFTGNPQFSYPVIHVTGTSGKGSTTMLISKILQTLGYKVGVHVSPFLVSPLEKFVVADPISGELLTMTEQEFCDMAGWFTDEYEKFSQKTEMDLSAYEAIIMMIFKFFEIKKVDVAVIEVAMGGMLDATNIVNSDVAVINSVGLDHMEYLGDTIEKIAWDKMHIFKQGKKSVSGITIPHIAQMISVFATSINNRDFLLGRDFDYKKYNSSLKGTHFDYIDGTIEFKNIFLSLFGEYQVHNATLAIKSVLEFVKDKNSLTPEILNKALGNIHIPARFDIISTNPLIIIDGAHNEMKMNGLVNSLIAEINNNSFNSVKLLIGFKEGKNYSVMIDSLLKLNPKEVFVTSFDRILSNNIKSIESKEIKNELINKGYKSELVHEFNDPQTAFQEFKNSITSSELGLVTGSLYLAGNIYPHI